MSLIFNENISADVEVGVYKRKLAYNKKKKIKEKINKTHFDQEKSKKP